MSRMWGLIRSNNWDGIRCLFNEPLQIEEERALAEELSKPQGHYRHTPFHRACMEIDTPNDIIRAMISTTDPFAYSQMDNPIDKRTPLHLACMYGSSSTVKAILEWLSPLPSPQLHSLLTRENDCGCTSLDVIWQSYREFSKQEKYWDRHRLEQLIEKTVLVLRALHSSFNCKNLIIPLEEYDREEVLHEIANFQDCPREVMWFALKLYPSQARKRDRHFNLPLHIICANRTCQPFLFDTSKYRPSRDIRYGPKSECPSISQTNSSHIRKCLPLRIKPRLLDPTPRQNFQDRVPVIEMLLDENPLAAHIPNYLEDRFPLNSAIASGRTWGDGVGALLTAFPDVIWRRDAQTGLYPFMLAAVAASGEDDDCDSLELVYILLCMDPGLVQSKTCGETRDELHLQ